MARWQLQLLGPLRLWRDDRSLFVERWPAHLRRLFACLAVHRRQGLSTETLIELFWPDLAPDRARAALWTAVSRLRRRLGGAWIERLPEGYRFHPDGSWEIDVDRFLTALEEARARTAAGDRTGAREAYARALAVYRDDLLTDFPYEEWLLLPRERLRDRALEARERLAVLALEEGDPREAAEQARRVLEVDACREETWRLLIRAYREMGDRGRALRAYDRCRAVLERELGVEPLPETRALAAEIRRELAREALETRLAEAEEQLRRGRLAEAEVRLRGVWEEALRAEEGEIALQALEGLTSLALARGTYEEALDWARRLRLAAERLGRREAVLWALQVLAKGYVVLGRPGPARMAAQEARALARRWPDPALQALALEVEGIVQVLQERYREAVGVQEEAVARWRRLGRPRRLADALHSLAVLRMYAGRDREAVDALEEALELWTGLQETGGALRSWQLLGHVCVNLGRWGRAREAFQRALALAEELTLPPDPLVWLSWGYLLWQQGEREEARSALEACLEAARRGGPAWASGVGLVYLGGLDLEEGEVARGLDRMEEGVEVLAATSALPSLAQAQGLLGAALRCLGDLEGAQAWHRQALSLTFRRPRRRSALRLELAADRLAAGEAAPALQEAERVALRARRREERILLARARLLAGEAHLFLGQLAEALDAVREALEIVRAERALRLQVQALELSARIWWDLGEGARAEGLLRQALSLSRRAGQLYRGPLILRLVRWLEEQGREAEAATWREKGRRWTEALMAALPPRLVPAFRRRLAALERDEASVGVF